MRIMHCSTVQHCTFMLFQVIFHTGYIGYQISKELIKEGKEEKSEDKNSFPFFAESTGFLHKNARSIPL